jgi:site-specific DNA-methyltransferase (cytosine-N4-specific)
VAYIRSATEKGGERVGFSHIEPTPNEPFEELVVEGYSTDHGTAYEAKIEDFLVSRIGRQIRGKVDLLFTSPPFPLHTKKRYGNLTGDEYLEWIKKLAVPFRELLKPKGSIVLEIGNAWEPGLPVMSTLPIRTLLEFLEQGDLHLCEQFVCHNPTRLPTPAQWVSVKRSRVKDSFTHVWWMSTTADPKASNKRVLTPYKDDMKRLLKTKRYSSGLRPSGHVVGETSFLKDNGGAIPANVLAFSNTTQHADYRSYCRGRGLKLHPAPMQPGLAEFFIKMLTDRGQLVLDPFAGSNLTGATAETLGRRWISVEPERDYVEGSRGRFASLRGQES